MRVTLNQSIHNNIGIYNISRKDVVKPVKDNRQSCTSDNRIANCYYSLISFRGSEEALLVKYCDVLKCAYTGRPMIDCDEVLKIFSKLERRPNAQSAIHLLQQYKKFMYDVEADIFDLLEMSDHKTKRDFADILREYVPSSLAKLEEKQRKVLKSTNAIVRTLSPETAELVNLIIENSKRKIENGSFTRSYPLELIKNIKGGEEDAKKLEYIYHAWYKLPRSSRDMDAFVVSYAKMPHDSIARRLISPAVATIEHIKPQSMNGADTLGNYLLVCSQVNSERSSMPLDEFIMLNPELEIPQNLQAYVNSVIIEAGKKGSLMADKSWYPEAVQRAVLEQTSGYVNLDISRLRLTKGQKRENSSPQRLKTKYPVKKM